MNQGSNEAPNLSLPAPVAETGADTFSAQENAPSSPEQASTAAEQMPQTVPQTMPVAMPTPLPLPTDDSTTDDKTDDKKTSKSVVTKVIEDKDLIDKEWVEKAKAIITRNRENPYKQTEELTEVKAEYMQKNYNKSIKLSK